MIITVNSEIFRYLYYCDNYNWIGYVLIKNAFEILYHYLYGKFTEILITKHVYVLIQALFNNLNSKCRQNFVNLQCLFNLGDKSIGFFFKFNGFVTFSIHDVRCSKIIRKKY